MPNNNDLNHSPDITPEHAEAYAWNKAAWDERVPAHWESAMYRAHADALRRGDPMLHDDLVQRAGDLTGKSLIHLQCHMGMETLAWALLGATTVGIDFSPNAIDKANTLRDELELDARFICTNVYDTRDHLDGETFDTVFVSIGSLCWLPDIARWATLVASLLKPGGLLLLNDVHPVINMLDDSDDPPGFAVAYPYLGDERLVLDDDENSYAAQDTVFQNNKMAEWPHTFGTIITQLVNAGLRIETMEESSRCVWPAFKVMEETAPFRWDFPGQWRGKVPVDFTLTARKP
ncbi:class I SAM-dependent methyltransferase [Phycisphaeraceae bacterium D3-23]